MSTNRKQGTPSDSPQDSDTNEEPAMTDAEFIAATIQAREASVKFFESSNRAERELWVAEEFLTNLGVPFSKPELVHVTDDPPDVLFRDARFEVKEILDEGKRRHDEHKESLELARKAKSPSELFESFAPRDIAYADACELVSSRAIALSKKYDPVTRRKLDLLFYVNLEDVFGYVPSKLPDEGRWSGLGFRSILVVMGRLSGILYAHRDAPGFLTAGGIRIVKAKSRNE